MRHLSLILIPLLFCNSLAAATITRGPYLQLQTDSSIIVRWRTDVPTESVVRYGDSHESLTLSAMGSGSTTEHSVLIDSLASAKRYYYSVGNSSGALAGDESYYFSTAPTTGSATDTRIWVIGDSGTANQNARDVRDAYRSWSGSDPADLWLMLGDNAYNNGTDAEYQAAVFDIYPLQLRQLPLWSTLGNHDGYSANSATQEGPYYEIFNLPTAAEAGGWASGTEAYYSFDHGNVHFICLNSYDSDRSANGAMLEWLMTDLAYNEKPWVIAFWHHPPYSKGSHDSDTEQTLIDMRQNALPILESQGVDLVLTGHSHSYERSKLIDGHYGSSASFDPTQHALDSGDGRDGGDGVYEKPSLVRAPHAGAVYAVAGSSGKVSNGYPLNHPAMFISLASLGSLVLDVNGNQLDGSFIDQAGVVQDSFTIRKGPDTEPPILTSANAPDATTVIAQFSEGLDPTSAGDPSNYSIAGLTLLNAEWLGDSRQVKLTTSNMEGGTPYTLDVYDVQDNAGNVIAAGANASFTYYNLMITSFQDAIAPSLAYAGTRDAYIREASPNTNYGLANSLQVDGDEPSGSSSDMNSLLMWDVTAIPNGSIAQAAEIVLDVTNVGGTYYCYGLQRSWVEAEVTWNQANGSVFWGNPGAEAGSDRGAEALCSINATSTGPLVIPLNAAGLASVQSWIDNPALNNGIILSDSLSSNGADFNSRESATALARPRLNVTYRTGKVPEYIDQFALSDVSTDGSNSGSFTHTLDDDGILQVLTERVSGGKKRNRTSLLTHAWRFSVAPGSAVTLYANTWSEGSTEGDAFVFAWSTDNVNYQDLFIVNSSSDDNVQSAGIGDSGTIYIRVQDTDRGAGNQQQDSIYIDQLYIRSDNGQPPPNQAPSALFTWNCSGLTCDFSDMSTDVDGRIASWHWTFGDTMNSTEQNPRHVYDGPNVYAVSLSVTDDDNETDYHDLAISVSATSAIVLESPNTYKVRGYHHVDLTWSGATATDVEIYRDNDLISTTVNDGAYTDPTGSKGGRTYVYKICEIGSPTCSNEVEATF